MAGEQVEKNGLETAEGKSSYQVVARRYRPQGFDKLIGQEHVAKALVGAITSGRVGHAYLFTGARGVGKTSSARILAKALNCVHGPTPTPCNECEICSAISAGDDIDVLEIDGASNRGIDEIRQLRQSATIKPSRARYKIYIIDEVHMLTREAFNALLKILEEPPEHVKFIFCTTEPNKLPITILSRCQRFDFAGINAETIAKHLRYIAQNEGVTADEGVCEMLARRANGSMRDAQSLLEQLLSFAPDHITMADVNGMLGTVDDQKIFDLLSAIRENAPAQIFPILARAAGEGVDFGILIEQMIGTFRDLLAVSCGCSADSLLYSGPGRFDEFKILAGAFGTPRVLASMQILAQTMSRMRYSTQGRILAEMALVRLCSLDRLAGAAQLIEQLRAGRIQGFIPSPVPPQISGAPVPPPLPFPQKKTAEIVATPLPSDSSVDVPKPSPLDSAVDQSSGQAEKPFLSSLDSSEILRIWSKAADQLGMALSAMAKGASRVDWDGSVLKIGFAPDKARDLAFEHCRNDSARISKAVSQYVADNPVPLHFYRTDEPISPVPVREKPKRASSTVKFDEMRKKIDHPMVQAVNELFGGNLRDVTDAGSGGY